TGFLQDCGDQTLLFIGPGARYQYTGLKPFSVGASLYLFLVNGPTWSSGNRFTVLIPFPNLELGAHLTERSAFRLGTAFIPGGAG
ncbi:hypothetical protein ABK046_49440, partial [Streptomyces caeruleatus]